jgi:hypothetical protein
MKKHIYLLAGMALVAAILACNLPSNQPTQPEPGAVMTAAALTVQAELSQVTATPIAPAATATFTPIPLATLPSPTLPSSATATSNCDNAQFVVDVTYPDGATVAAGDNFTKTWRLKNIGACSWTPSYALVFISGNDMGGPAVQALTGNVNPGQTVDLSVALTAPSSNGTYTGNWGLRNASGVIFAHFYVQIKVGSGSGGAFAVNHVNMSASGGCGHFTIIAAITTNGPGSVTYHWVRSDGAIDTLTHPALVYSSAGTQSVSTDWYVTAHGSFWMDIYIDSPNHQQFGRANFSCP